MTLTVTVTATVTQHGTRSTADVHDDEWAVKHPASGRPIAEILCGQDLADRMSAMLPELIRSV